MELESTNFKKEDDSNWMKNQRYVSEILRGPFILNCERNMLNLQLAPPSKLFKILTMAPVGH